MQILTKRNGTVEIKTTKSEVKLLLQVSKICDRIGRNDDGDAGKYAQAANEKIEQLIDSLEACQDTEVSQ